MHKTGGFAGINERLRLSGRYELELSPTDVDPPQYFFTNAQIWGSLISHDPHIAIVEDVDELLSINGLTGQQVPVAAPFDVFKFRGETDDGSSIRLIAAKFGPWMYVRGGTTPPPGSADFFEYNLKMIARSRPSADLNEDGRVDAADYTVLRDRAGAAGAGSISASTDEVTYSDWREQFGEQVPDFTVVDEFLAGAGSGFSTALLATATPEPTTAALVCLCCAMLGARRIRVR